MLPSTQTTLAATTSDFWSAVNTRDYEATLLLGFRLLHTDRKSTSRGKVEGGKVLGRKRWDILEQVIIACCQFRLLSQANACYEELLEYFGPRSCRVRRLCGMLYESDGSWSRALQVYWRLLAERADDVVTRKRVIVVYRLSGNMAAAIEMLNKHLDEFGLDYEAWEELGDIYFTTAKYPQALFCFEEAVLVAPWKPGPLITFCETLATLGHINQALQMYLLGLIRFPKNLRFLWGFVMTSTTTSVNRRVVDQSSSTLPALNREREIVGLCLQTITRLYKTQPSSAWRDSCLALCDELLETHAEDRLPTAGTI